MKTTTTTSILDANGCKIIWGFLLENTLFTEFEKHNHAIIENAYRQRKKKQASHYIVIVDANLPKPCKAKVYFGVVQNHLRMPGTRYYVNRHIVEPSAIPINDSVKNTSLAPPPPLFMPSPMSTSSSSTTSSDAAYPSLDPSMAALFLDDPSSSSSSSSFSITDSSNAFTMDEYVPKGVLCNDFLLDISTPHSFNNIFSSFFSMHYETNDQNSDHQFMNSNINVNDYINKPYIGTDYNNRQDKGSTSNNQSIHISCSQTQPNVKYPGASHGKCNRRPNMQLSLNCSQYQQQRLRKNQQQEQQQQQQQQYDIIHTHTNNYESLNSNDLGSSSISENSNLLVGDMTWLSVCNFSNIDNSLFQEFVPWPVFDGPKPNCGQKQDDISRIYHTF